MSHIPHWIETQLSTRFEGLNLAVGVDFDGSGAIESAELTDTNNDGQVDADEWRAFLNANESTLRNFGGFFNYYFDYGTAFKPDNPLHDIFFIESVIADETQIASAYRMVEAILEQLNSVSTEGECSPDSISKIYSAMYGVGMTITNGGQAHAYFTENILNKSVDCDTSSDILMVLAHEFGCMTNLVASQEHMFINFEDDTSTFTADSGLVWQTYPSPLASFFHEGVYFVNLSSEETLGHYYGRVGNEYFKRGDYEEALTFFDKAVDLYPNSVIDLLNRGDAKRYLGDDEGAFRDFNRVIHLDPDYARGYAGRSQIRLNMGDMEGVISDLERAHELEPWETKWSLWLFAARGYYWNSQDMGGGPF